MQGPTLQASKENPLLLLEISRATVRTETWKPTTNAAPPNDVRNMIILDGPYNANVGLCGICMSKTSFNFFGVELVLCIFNSKSQKQFYQPLKAVLSSNFLICVSGEGRSLLFKGEWSRCPCSHNANGRQYHRHHYNHMWNFTKGGGSQQWHTLHLALLLKGFAAQQCGKTWLNLSTTMYSGDVIGFSNSKSDLTIENKNS